MHWNECDCKPRQALVSLHNADTPNMVGIVIRSTYVLNLLRHSLNKTRDIAENVEEVKLICILVSINNCSINNQPEFCHYQASGLATISIFPLGVRNMGAFPHPTFVCVSHI